MCEYYLLHIITATSMCNFHHIINIAMPLLQGSYCYYYCGVLIAATVCNADVSVCKCYNHRIKVDILPLLWYKGPQCGNATAATCKCCHFYLNVATALCKYFHCYLICI